MDYRQIKKKAEDDGFLSVKSRANPLRGVLLKVNKKGQILTRVTSGTFRGKFWYQQIELCDFARLRKEAAKKGTTPLQVMKKAITGRLKLRCTCPAYLYWGFKYISWEDEFGLQEETRRPDVRNPHLKGTVCKHLYKVLTFLPFYAQSLVNIFSKQEIE